MSIRSDTIHSTLYDGSSHHLILNNHETITHPFAITVFENHLYWTDWRIRGVLQADKWRGSSVFVVRHTNTQPFDLKVIHSSRQPSGSQVNVRNVDVYIFIYSLMCCRSLAKLKSRSMAAISRIFALLLDLVF